MNREELLAEAIRRYPVGTVFNSTGGNDDCIIKDPSLLYWKDEEIWADKAEQYGRTCKVYYESKNKWAVITSTLKKEIINDYQIF